MKKTLFLLAISCNVAFGQIKVEQFNAGWNSANDVSWVQELSECKTIGYTDIAKNTDAQNEFKIAVVPTIIIFKDGEEACLLYTSPSPRDS